MTKPPSKMKTKLIRVTNLYDVTVKQFYAYVRNLHRHIRLQNAKIRRLRRKIVSLRKLSRQKSNVKEVKEQEEDDGEDFMKALERAEAQQAQASENASEPLNVKAFVDDIKKTAQEFDYQNRYIYEPTSGLYYDPETGYYYNAIYGLHYDGQRGCYLKYNEQTQKYDFYSQVIPEESLEKEKPKTFQKKRKQQPEDERERRRERRKVSRSRSRSRERELQRRRRRRHHRSRSRSYHSVSSRSSSSSTDDGDKQKRKKKREKERTKKQKQRKDKRSKEVDSDEYKEEGELDSSSGGDSDRSERRVILIDSSGSEKGNAAIEVDLDKYADKHSDVSRKYPPSLRLIVQETNLATLKQGSLFIITCKGGTLGREGDHDVIIPDINISKYHLTFTYQSHRSSYQVLDLGSRNGTFLNGTRMAPTMQESDTFDIAHGDIIELNRTKLLCHIHEGSYTCSNCEPGLLMKSGERTEEERITKPVSHKEGLKLLQRRFGLEDEKYVEPTGSSVVDYNDRAAHRRKIKGSSNEHAKTQKSSVNEQISSENKGFKMLSKLGWNEGQSLGKNDQGLKEPIPMKTNVGTSGLGSRMLVEPTTGPDDSKKSVWQRAQARYKACEDVEEDADDGEPMTGSDEAKKLIWEMTQERYKACAAVKEDAGAKGVSLDQHISSENKGFQMLAKLGWNEGDSLGKEGGDGLKEPINLLSNVGTSGLGSKPLKKPGANVVASGKKKTIWKKKQNKCSAAKLFKASDSE